MSDQEPEPPSQQPEPPYPRREYPPKTLPIATEKVFAERKTFFLDLKENDRGRFLKITEDNQGRRDTIMLPATAFKDFVESLARLIEFEAKI